MDKHIEPYIRKGYHLLFYGRLPFSRWYPFLPHTPSLCSGHLLCLYPESCNIEGVCGEYVWSNTDYKIPTTEPFIQPGARNVQNGSDTGWVNEGVVGETNTDWP